MADSVNQSNPSVVGGNDHMHGYTNEHLESLVKMLIRILKNALIKQNCIRKLLSKCKMLETVVLSELLRGNFIMGKDQIARLQGNQAEVLADPAELCVFVIYVPTLDLPESGYTMNNVMFVSAIPVYQDAENVVELMDDEAAKETMDVAFLDGSIMRKWGVFDEAVRQIVNDNREPMYVARVPYSNIVQ